MFGSRPLGPRRRAVGEWSRDVRSVSLSHHNHQADRDLWAHHLPSL